MEKLIPQVLIIEDDEAISKLICMYLKKEEINPIPFLNAEDALNYLEKNSSPDLIILDLNLPGMSGFEFLENFRKTYDKSIPVMIASARDADEDIIQGLGFGADEFVSKPFSPRVLAARVQASLRRQAFTTAKAEETITFGNYTLLLNSCILKKGSIKIPLSQKEYEVLEYLVKNYNQVLSPEKIFNDVWKVEFGDITAVAVYIQRLRKKLESADSSEEYIRTEFGKGYRFVMKCEHSK